MRELILSKPKVAIAIIAVMLVVSALIVFRLIQSKTPIAHAQPEQLVNNVSNVAAQDLGSAQPVQGLNSASSTPEPSSTELASNTASSTQTSTNSIGSDTSESSKSANLREIGVVKGQTVYDSSGNACGIGPTGICVTPFAGRSIEIQDLSGNHLGSVVSELDGTFNLLLAPGQYKLIPGPGAGVNPTAQSQIVTVTNGLTTEVTISYWAIAITNTVSL